MANEATVTLDDTLREAEALMEKGLHGRALDLLNEVKQRPEANARLWFDLGTCLAAVNRNADAVVHFRKSAELAGDDRDAVGKALEHAGLAQYNRRHHKDAGELYRQALAVRKAAGDKAGEARCHRSLGNIHLDLGERPAARNEFETARKLSQEAGDSETLAICIMSLASLDYEKEGRSAAIATYRKAIAEDPCEHHIVLNNLGFLLTLDQELDEARDFLQRAWKDIRSRGENDEDAGLIQLNLGNVALLSNRLEEAETHLTEASKRFEKDTRGRLIEIVVLPNLKYREQGFDPLLLADDALKAAVVRLNIATLRMLQGKADEALVEAKAAVDLDPVLAYGHATLGWLHLARNEQDEAVAAFRKAQGKVPNDPQLKKILEQVNPWFAARTGRNDPCPCGSGKKFKKCHGG